MGKYNTREIDINISVQDAFWDFSDKFIIALPESFPDLYEPDKLLQLFADRFKEKYGVECVPTLHHNKPKTG